MTTIPVNINEPNQKFDFNTIQNFDEHINKSIPNYDILISAIKSISEYFFVDTFNIYDLGCSTGALLNSITANCNKIGYDNSNLLPEQPGFEKVDLNEKIDIRNACVVYSIFTMQFLRPSRRIEFLKEIYNGLSKGGCLIICEKIYQVDGNMQEVFTFSYYDYKLTHFNASALFSKERDLRKIMKPCNEKYLQELLVKTGFSVSQFWQMFNFKGYVAIK